MSGEDALNFLLDNRFPRAWQLQTIGWMCWHALNSEDPDEEVQRWFDEAADSDEAELRWAIQTWRYVGTSSSTTCELLRLAAAAG